jgi:ABC-type multidrug transport system, ATPase component
MNIIEFTHVSKIYRKGFLAIKVPAVIDLSFSVRQGAITGFVGPNGAGKTTTIKMILGLVYPTSGVVRLCGKDASDPKSRRDIAFISEQPYFYQHLTVAEALGFAARLHGRAVAALPEEIGRILETVDLVKCEKRKIKELSKGMQQRLAMVQALLLHSSVLIFDEPMSGMDPPGRNLFRKILLSLAAQGRTIFFSTHILDDIEQLCSDVVVISKGRLEYQGPISGILQKGFKGFDLVVPSLPDQLKIELRHQGYEVEAVEQKAIRIFVPSDKDLVVCQRYLYEHGVFCESLTKRNLPLEEVLYKK